VIIPTEAKAYRVGSANRVAYRDHGTSVIIAATVEYTTSSC
jgi:hypothetical protein